MQSPPSDNELVSWPFRFAMGNEAFDRRPFIDACRTLRSIGYPEIGNQQESK